ncbi:MAG: ATPase P [Blautia sp.]|nr:ATPase P [Blautia sp.]
MLLTRPLSRETLNEEILKSDKKNCRKIGPCGLGEKALYLNSFYFDRIYYIPIPCVRRIYKRVAMSRGGFTGKGLFASIPYLVVEYDDGKEKQCNFKFEEKVDQFLAAFHEKHPAIPLHSRAAQERLRQKELALAKKRKKNLPQEVKDEIILLENAGKFMEVKPQLYSELSLAAKAVRINDRSNPAYKWVALAIVLMGFVSCGLGIRALIQHAGNAVYFLLFGLAVVFLFSGANVLPTRRNNRRYIRQRYADAKAAMAKSLEAYPGFPVPARYAHPFVLEWMAEILREGRAETHEQALEVLKEDLKARNASVTVEQEEYDRIMAIKPMFLIANYE